MKKITLRKSLFNNFINHDFNEKFKEVFNSKTSDVKFNELVLEYIENFSKNIIKEEFYGEMIKYFNNPKFFDEYFNRTLRICKKCLKPLPLFDDIYIDIKPKKPVCTCSERDPFFNYSNFVNNLNIFCFNFFCSIWNWNVKISQIIDLIKTYEENNFKSPINKSLLNYEINNLFCNVISYIDAFKAGVIIIENNSQVDFFYILHLVTQSKNNKIKEAQNSNSTTFVNSIKKIQISINENKLDAINEFEKYGVFSITNSLRFKKIKNNRNILMHNNFYHAFQPLENFNLTKEKYKLSDLLICIVNTVLLFYVFLNCLGCIK